MLKDHKEIIKHSSAIQIENSISLLQRKAWNVLFARAYDKLPEEEIHHVNVQELTGVLGYGSTNHRHLKDSIKALVTTGVEWNVLNKDKEEEWGVTTLLAQAQIKSGVCAYAYSPEMRERLHNPAMYARISLELQNKFSSKHALALFELFRDYFDESRQFGETPFIEIPIFRKLMGIPDKKYPEFKILNKWVIKDSIKEIHNITEYMIDVEYKRGGRKVVAVKFKIAYIPKINVEEEQGEMFEDTQRLPPLVTEMVAVGVHQRKAFKIWSQSWKGIEAKDRPRDMEFAEYVREKIDLLEIDYARGKIEDKGAWLVGAIRDNYYHPTYKKRARARRIREQIQELEQEAKKIKEQQAMREFEILEPLFTDENLEQAFEGLQQSPTFQNEWNDYAHDIKRGMEESQWFKAGLRLRIKAENIEKFAVLDEYQERIQKIESQIQRLKAKQRGN